MRNGSAASISNSAAVSSRSWAQKRFGITQREKLHVELASTTDYTQLAAIGSAAAEVQADLDLAEERWLELHLALEQAR